MSNLEPGDLARITYSNIPENMNLVVQCIKIELHHPIMGPCWLVRIQDPVDAIITESTNMVIVGRSKVTEGLQPAKWLKKIEPPKSNTTIERKNENENDLQAVH